MTDDIYDAIVAALKMTKKHGEIFIMNNGIGITGRGVHKIFNDELAYKEQIHIVNATKHITGIGTMYDVGRGTCLGAAFDKHRAMSNPEVIAGYSDWLARQFAEGNMEVVNTLNAMIDDVRNGRTITLMCNSDRNHGNVIRQFIITQLEIMENQ